MSPRALRVLATLLLTGPVAALAQSNATVYVSIGDSLADGVSSGSLVETHQLHSVPALIARQAGAPDFQQALITEPGFPAELTLVSLNPLVIAPKSNSRGFVTNPDLARPYNNLAVPGATASDALNTTTGERFHRIILRGLGSQVTQAVALHPTFVTVWIGDSDVSGAALVGVVIEGVTITPTDEFRQSYSQIIAELKATGAGIVAANIGDPMTIPFVSTIKPYVVDPATQEPVLLDGHRVALLGPEGPLAPGSYVTLGASDLLAHGIGIPKQLGGTGEPLPDEVVVDPGEVALIRDHLDKDNQAIAQVCQQAGVPVVDLHHIYQEMGTTGRDVGGIHVSADFLTGGFFSYDALHPTELGYALMANEWIEVINANGGHVPLVDLGPFLGTSPSSAGGRAPGRLPTAAGPPAFSKEAWDALRLLFGFVSQ